MTGSDKQSLRLSKAVYSERSVLAAIQMYEPLAEIQLKSDLLSDCYDLTVSECVYDPLLTIKEFENYVIGMENQKW